MEVSYSLHQVTGSPVDNKSINQQGNLGGNTPGFVARFFNCDDNSGCGQLIHTTATVSSLEALEQALDETLGKLLEGKFNKVSPSAETINRKFRGIVA